MSMRTLRESVLEAIDEEMQKNGAVIILGEDPSRFAPKFQERIINLPYGEGMITSTALGLAMTGARPVVFLPGEYLLRSADVIANEIALTEAMYASQYDSGVVIVSPVGFEPQTGPQMSQSYEAVFAQFTGVIVIYPSNASDAKALMKAAMSQTKPVLFLENRRLLGEPAEIRPEPVRIGQSGVVREGKDVTIVTYGPMVQVCLKAAQLASESGLYSEVIDLKTIKPLDVRTIAESIKKTNKLIVVHEARKFCGVGAEICAQIVESEALYHLESRIIRVCCDETPVSYSEKEFEKQIPNEEDILRAIIQLSTGE